MDEDGNAVTTFDNGKTKTSKLTSIASASASAKKAATSESNAKDYADKALVSETNAKTSETNAATYADNAKKSEIAAKTSETNAAASASTATAQASNAGKSATAAKASETNAKSSETASATSEANARTSASNAAMSASNSASSASASEVSNQNSKKWAEYTGSPDGTADTGSTTGKTQSSRSWALYSKAKAQESASSATSASASASSAASSAASASDSRDKASEYKTSASGSATAAASSASSASTAATNAKAAMNTANTAASSASTSATSASTSASNASKSEIAAKTAQAAAEKARDDANSAVTKLTGVMKYAGQVDDYSDLSDKTKNKGDVWNVVNADDAHGVKAGDNVVWNGADWDNLSGYVDLSAFAQKDDYQKVITSATANGATITFNHKDGTTSTATVNNVASATVATNDAKGQKIDTTYEKIADASNVHTSLQNSINSLSTGKQDKLTFDTAPTANSSNPVTSGGIKTVLDTKLDKTGTAVSASKLQTARTISLTGNVSGSATFDGSTNINISTTVNESKHAAAADTATKATQDASGNVITTTYAKKSEIPSVSVKGVKISGSTSNLTPDTSGIVTIPAIPTKVSTFTNDSGYLTAHQDLSGYQTKLTFDSTPTANSSNPVTSAGIKAAIDAKTVDLSNYYTKTQVDSAISTAISAIVDGDRNSY